MYCNEMLSMKNLHLTRRFRPGKQLITKISCSILPSLGQLEITCEKNKGKLHFKTLTRNIAKLNWHIDVLNTVMIVGIKFYLSLVHIWITYLQLPLKWENGMCTKLSRESKKFQVIIYKLNNNEDITPHLKTIESF